MSITPLQVSNKLWTGIIVTMSTDPPHLNSILTPIYSNWTAGLYLVFKHWIQLYNLFFCYTENLVLWILNFTLTHIPVCSNWTAGLYLVFKNWIQLYKPSGIFCFFCNTENLVLWINLIYNFVRVILCCHFNLHWPCSV